MLGRFVSALTTGSLVLCLTAAAAAQEDARALFMQGQAAYETGDYNTAVRLWTRAYELDDRPLLQYNLAQAYERLGQLDQAVTAYRIYIDHTPGDDQRATNARARIASLEQRVGQTSITLTGGVQGAHVVIDGSDRGLLPRPDAFHVDPGSHRIVVRADGYADFVSTVAVSAGQQASVAVEMQPGTSGTAPNTLGGGGISTVGLIVALGGAGLVIGGAIVGGVALGQAGSAPGNTGPEADGARTTALVADILFGLGGAAVVAGVVLMFVLEPDLGGSGASARFVPVVGPDFAGGAVQGQF
ncbi:MAG: tetratricopeptide repeat protein [Sandaracinaceae bacterium]|nr:tetratricopeptide repeat protein [Sandaracinaceae bacterium]